MIWKLLKKNVSIWQITGYAVSNLIGLVIVLSAVRFYGDVAAALAGDDSDDSSSAIISPDYLVGSKPVSLFNSSSGGTYTFTPQALADRK